MGKLYDFIEEKNKREMVPMEQWDGECWRTIFETMSSMFPEDDPWDVFARFMQGVLNQD